MGKDGGGFLAPKQIANRIKARGLQKLRWYCQMCQKQCRDENGFKCHTMSESHMRQMEMFSQNSKSFMDEFSTEFEGGMMEIIARKARSKRMSANQIYKEYISDKQHFHMNATIWETLTDFVMYLGREGKCEVDETEKGWFVTYVDRDPEKLRKLEERAKRERTELDSSERHERDLMRQAKAAREALGDGALAPSATELQRTDPDQKVALSLGGGGGPSKGKARLAAPLAAGGASLFGADDGAGTSGGGGGGGGGGAGKAKPPSGIASLMAEEQRRKEAVARREAEDKAAAAAAAAPPSDAWLTRARPERAGVLAAGPVAG